MLLVAFILCRFQGWCRSWWRYLLCWYSWVTDQATALIDIEWYLSSQFLFGTVEVYDKVMTLTFLAIRGDQRLVFPSFAKLCLRVMRLKALYRQDTKQAQLWLEDASHLNHALVTFYEVLKFCHCFAIVQPRNSTFTDRCKLWQHGTTTRKPECWSVRVVVLENVWKCA